MTKKTPFLLELGATIILFGIAFSLGFVALALLNVLARIAGAP